MAALAIIASVLIAVASWFVSQAQARQATRRNMRIDYLLDAYRRLDRASNGRLSQGSARDLEAAVSDIMLLGSPRQAGLAEEFARTFAAKGDTDAGPLLQDLRDSLRGELLLERLPSGSYVSLRIDTSGDSVSDHARIWRETVQTARRSLDTELGGEHSRGDIGVVPTEGADLVGSVSPSAAVAASAQQVELELRALLADSTTDDLSGLNLAQLTNRALQLGLIDSNLADSLNGLSIMRILAAMDQDRLTVSRAAEFTSLSTAVVYLLSLVSRKRYRKSPEPSASGTPGVAGL